MNRKKAMGILQREAELEELVRLVGVDSLTAEGQSAYAGCTISGKIFSIRMPLTTGIPIRP